MPARSALPVLVAFCLPALAAAQEAPLLSSTCLGVHRDIALEAGGAIDLRGEITSFGFGPDLLVCVEPDSVTLYAPEPVALDCASIRDSADEGIGHDFEVMGVGHHLWFHISPARSPQVLEIGLYKGETELTWIDTGVEICPP